MDQGVIRSLKAKYRSLAVKKQIDALMPMSMLTKAWNSIPDGKLTNRFKKSGISGKTIKKALNDEDDPFASLDVEEDVIESLKDDLKMMKEKFHENCGMTAEELVGIDFEMSVTSTSSDANIITEVSVHVNINDEEESNDEEQPTDCISKPVFKDVMNAITVLEDYSLFSNFGADLMKAIKDVNRAFDLHCLSNKKQSTIKDFFQTF